MKTNFDFTLRTPLGKWIQVSTRTQQWTTYIDSFTHIVYEIQENEWYSYELQPRSQSGLCCQSPTRHSWAICKLNQKFVRWMV